MNNILCFHNPDEENGWMSNWYPSFFELGGFSFSSLEQYMMYSKAVLVAGYNDVVWNGVRQIIVYQGLLAKFTQSAALGEKLKETGASVLAECAVHDKIWGIGLSMHDPNRYNMQKWQGQNLLGFSLMQVRAQIRH